MAITKDMLITDILDQDMEIAQILMQKGMHCIGCMAASGESLEQAMYVHGFTPEDVIKAADRRMYYGKQHGKNVVVYEDNKD